MAPTRVLPEDVPDGGAVAGDEVQNPVREPRLPQDLVDQPTAWPERSNSQNGRDSDSEVVKGHHLKLRFACAVFLIVLPGLELAEYLEVWVIIGTKLR